MMIFLRWRCRARTPRGWPYPAWSDNPARSDDEAPNREQRPDQAVIPFRGVLVGAYRQSSQLAPCQLRCHLEAGRGQWGTALIEHPPSGLTGEHPCAAGVAEVELDGCSGCRLSPVLGRK